MSVPPSTSIYRPPYTIPKPSEKELVLKVIKEHNFATLISIRDDFTPHVTHLPLLYSETSMVPSTPSSSSPSSDTKPEFYLQGHCALANPHWRRMLESPTRELLIIFNGPHTYISPSWYKSPQEHVPTWNYAVVHVKALPKTVIRENDPQSTDIKKNLVIRLSNQEEQRTKEAYSSSSGYEHNVWDLLSTNSAESIQRDMNNIVAFELHVTAVTPKFKMSGNRSQEDFDSLKLNLERLGNTDTLQYMSL